MKKLFWIASFVLTATLAACASTPTATPPPAVPATESAPTGLILAGGVVASAEAMPAQDTQISFPISAPVKEVLVKEGDAVTAGQILVTITSPDLELAVTAAELDAQAAVWEYQYWIPARLDRPPERRKQAEA